MSEQSDKQEVNGAERSALAHRYIESVIEINRRHGMGSAVPQQVYESVVRDTEKAMKGISSSRSSR